MCQHLEKIYKIAVLRIYIEGNRDTHTTWRHKAWGMTEMLCTITAKIKTFIPKQAYLCFCPFHFRKHNQNNLENPNKFYHRNRRDMTGLDWLSCARTAQGATARLDAIFLNFKICYKSWLESKKLMFLPFLDIFSSFNAIKLKILK